jgi:hypothetical protein
MVHVWRLQNQPPIAFNALNYACTTRSWSNHRFPDIATYDPSVPLTGSSSMVPAPITSPAPQPEWSTSGDFRTNLQLRSMPLTTPARPVLGQITNFPTLLLMTQMYRSRALAPWFLLRLLHLPLHLIGLHQETQEPTFNCVLFPSLTLQTPIKFEPLIS